MMKLRISLCISENLLVQIIHYLVLRGIKLNLCIFSSFKTCGFRDLLLSREVPAWGLIVLLISKAGGIKSPLSHLEYDVTAGNDQT